MFINGIATFLARVNNTNWSLIQCVVSKYLKDSFLLGHMTQKELGVLDQGWPYTKQIKNSNNNFECKPIIKEKSSK